MQTQDEDRRSPNVRRVELETLVEICCKDPDAPAFEAESIEVSGRGMQVRTRFLPELQTPLVLRFESAGKEVLVEGEVAWREGDEEGGQFGVKFTALDSNSVSALRALCTKGAVQIVHDDDEDDDDVAPQPYLSERGAPVKLHIQGLGAPMKARVCKGTARRLQVGSQLEFLKVGRTLDLEDVSGGSRRSAHIDTVTVAIEPESQIPQLVVSLRYEGVDDDTPEPTVTRAGRSRDADDAYDAYDDDYDDDGYDDEEEVITEDLFKGKVGALAANAGRAMKNTSAEVARWSASALGGVGSLLRNSAVRVAEHKPKSKAKPSRRTSRAPQGTTARRRHQHTEPLRRQGAGRSRRVELTAPLWRRPKLWLYGGAVTLSATAAFALFGESESGIPSDAETYEASSSVSQVTPARAGDQHPGAAGPAVPGQAMPGQTVPGAVARAPAPGVASPLIVPGPGPGGPPPIPARASLDAQEQLRVDTHGIVAQVPLFGAKTMATTEPAPLDPAPIAAVDEYSLSKDQAFTDKIVSAPKVEEQHGAPAEDSAMEFQVGRMHLPIVHRLRLDAPGAALQGTKTPSGFSVLLPGRKVMENGSAIANRDDRIVNVRVSNTPAGGKIAFRFRKDIPGYKARLRNDYVEFFINSPPEK